MFEDQRPVDDGALPDLETTMRAFGVSSWRDLGASDQGVYADTLEEQIEIEGQRYLLRERPEGLLVEDPGHRYRFQRYLRLAGLPIPAFWLTPTGEAFVAIEEARFELQAWPEGELFASADPRNLAWTAAAGTMLGQLHQASLRYPGPEQRWPSEAQAGGLVQGWLNLARGKAEECQVSAVALALEHWIEQWEQALPAAMMAIGSVHPLPELHIHGDYRPDLLRFESAGVSAVLGFQAARWEKRLLEVAAALFAFCALEWRPGEHQPRPLVKRGLDAARARAFLGAYGAVYPPAPQESLLLVDALALTAPIATLNGPLEDLIFAPVEALEGGPPIEDLLERLAWASTLPGWLQRVRGSLAEMWSEG